MQADWAQLEGRIVNGVFPLLRLLGSSERSAVFLSRSARDGASSVALKLVPAIAGRAELLLPRWRSASSIEHPHLLRLFEVGECEIDGQRYLYSAMEYAEQTLAQLLEHRALAPNEVREMLGPTLHALEFLHGSKRVQGGLKPSNVLVVGDQVKLASDAIGPAADIVNSGGASAPTSSPYQAPEAGGGAGSTAADIWALGVVVCEALSRRKPAGLQAIAGSIALPPDIPSPFREMISKCLSRKPEDRPDIARLQAWQQGGDLDSTPARQEEAVDTDVAPKPPAASSTRLVIRAEIKPPDEIAEPDELKAQWRPMRLIAAAAVLLVIVAGAVYFFSPGDTPREANAPVAAPPVAAETPPLQPAAPEAPATQARATPAPEKPAPATPTPRPVSAPRAPASDSPSAINEVLPVVPPSASQTIRGTVRVSVRVIVDADGKVVAATPEDPGPSRYFERLSLEAAKKWMFAPAAEAGRQRVMVVKFNYTRSGTTAKSVTD